MLTPEEIERAIAYPKDPNKKNDPPSLPANHPKVVQERLATTESLDCDALSSFLKSSDCSQESAASTPQQGDADSQ